MTDEIFDLVLQVVTLLSVMIVVAVEAIVVSAVMLLGPVLIGLGALRSPFSRTWRMISVQVELSGLLGSRGMACSVLSILLLGGSDGGPRFWSSRLSTTSASTMTYWLALCSISSTVVKGHSMSDQKRWEGLIPIINASITNDICASGMSLTSFVKQARYRPRGSSSFYFIPRRDAAIGFGWALARKLVSNSLTSWLKECIEMDGNRLYHPRAIPCRVVEKARHIMASNVP
ncbi:hypothetical protein OPV22_010584 [Ensete ventricosum]|uniref:Uncharacterized protein n=1 Tax=Ensete ventricosum TaxID=4639 RepID=A0AAV8RFX7_ENSVE|nr:hypothetical protein OPV22_010584 [Ensete ventricosum]